MKKSYYAKVAQETEKCFPKLLDLYGYEEIKKSKLYKNKEEIDFVENKESSECFLTEIKVLNIDTVDCAIKLKSEGEDLVVLNMASEKNPGGGWKKGASAQEEAIFKRSDYALHLDSKYDIELNSNWDYPIPIYGAVYSTNVTIFRDNEENEFQILKPRDHVKFDFIALPAVRNPKLVSGKLDVKDASTTKEKMRTFFSLALSKNKIPLLSAMGSGAFHNPPKHIAELFNEVINEETYKNKFKKIYFSIIDGSRTNNYEIFKDYFDSIKIDK